MQHFTFFRLSASEIVRVVRCAIRVTFRVFAGSVCCAGYQTHVAYPMKILGLVEKGQRSIFEERY
jgi:hypothetical protein